MSHPEYTEVITKTSTRIDRSNPSRWLQVTIEYYVQYNSEGRQIHTGQRVIKVPVHTPGGGSSGGRSSKRKRTPAKTNVFGKQPPSAIDSGVNFTVWIDTVFKSGGGRDPDAKTTFRVFAAPMAAGVITNGLKTEAGTPTSYVYTDEQVNGRVAVTLAFNDEIITTGRYRLVANPVTNKRATNSPVSSGVNVDGIGGDAVSLEFTTQPPTLTSVGLAMDNFVVSAVNDQGVVDPLKTGSVTIALYERDGVTPLENLLVGTKTKTLSAGNATFSSIICPIAGTFVLIATIADDSLTPITSQQFTISGDFPPSGVSGRRQNIRDDGTIVQKTTGLSESQSDNQASTSEKGILDGDMAVADSVTTDGIRYVFPFFAHVQLVNMKFSLSSLDQDPNIQVFISSDTTDGTDGTWQLQALLTPRTANSQIQTVQFASVVAVKGIWVTLNDNGGTATCSWKAIHVGCLYIGSTAEILDGIGGEIINDELALSVPLPAENIPRADTVQRRLIFRNQSGVVDDFNFALEAARFGGDTLADSDNYSLLLADGSALVNPITIAAGGQFEFIAQYTILEADNVQDGQHLARVTITTVEPPTSDKIAWWWVSDPTAASSSFEYRKVDGSSAVTISVGGRDAKWVAVDDDNDFAYLCFPSGANWRIDKYVATTGVLDTSSWATLTPSGTPSSYATSRYRGGFIYASSGSSTAIARVDIGAVSVSDTFSIASQTTGQKMMAWGPSNDLFISEGDTATSKIYRYTLAGSLVATIDPSTEMAGNSIASIYYDSRLGDLYVISAWDAGNSRRVAARYSSTGSLRGTVFLASESGRELHALWSYFDKLYAGYSGQKIYQYDVRTWANETLESNLTGADDNLINDVGSMQIP